MAGDSVISYCALSREVKNCIMKSRYLTWQRTIFHTMIFPHGISFLEAVMRAHFHYKNSNTFRPPSARHSAQEEINYVGNSVLMKE